ncbi:hypothetical protein LPJ66_001122 [Kickxella alabastrina]|uniref:Uncharacterized protein n=1 Tax=Kickxella alabastrina TaxID=61397 RepID=A0ACC1IUF9_9FUNG|nr:hypothetical protein LPJ66_001122 [Kickxella alabastrina]
MTRSKHSKNRQQAKKAAAKSKSSQKSPAVETVVLDTRTEQANPNACGVGDKNRPVSSGYVPRATNDDECIVSEIVSLSENVLHEIVQALKEDYGLADEASVDPTIGSDAGVIGQDDELIDELAAEDRAQNVSPESSRGQQRQMSYNEMVRENARLQAMVIERDYNIMRLQYLVSAQQQEIHMAHSQIAQRDGYMANEVRHLVSRLPVPSDVHMLLQGLQRQYALREEHFASVEKVLKLEAHLWQERFIIAENRDLANTEAIHKLTESADARCAEVHRLKTEIALYKQQGMVAKQRLEHCALLLETLVGCNKDRQEMDTVRIKELMADVEDLSNIKTSMMDYARTAMMKSHKLEDLCRALQMQRNEYLQKQKHENLTSAASSAAATSIVGVASSAAAAPLATAASSSDVSPSYDASSSASSAAAASSTTAASAAPISVPILTTTPASIPASSSPVSVSVPSWNPLTPSGKTRAFDYHFESEGPMVDLEPLMSQILAEHPLGNSPHQCVVVGQSPRVIRMPRRLHSSTKPASDSTALLPTSDVFFGANDGGGDKDSASQSQSISPLFVTAYSTAFTFSSP